VSASRAAEILPGSAELRGALAGLCGTLVGIGLARFAYAPLLPALIESGWFASAKAAYIAAANLVGYLAGGVLTVERWMAHTRKADTALRAVGRRSRWAPGIRDQKMGTNTPPGNRHCSSGRSG
jgi:hypothetical protein